MPAVLDDAYALSQFSSDDDGDAAYSGKKMNWLTDAVSASYESMERFRKLNTHLVEAYVGPGYLGRADEKPKYLEKLTEAIDAYQTLLAGGNPKCEISSHLNGLEQFAFRYQQSLNHLSTEIHLKETLERWVVDACLLIGIVKVHVADSGHVMFADGLSLDPGVPNASNISLDDWVVDMSAKCFRAVKFAGDKYRIPYREFKEGVAIGMYDEIVAKDVRPASKHDSQDGTLAEAIRSGDSVDADDVEPMVDLADIWCPRDGKVYTFAVTGAGRFRLDPRPLAEMDWVDPECGPYATLGFRVVPDAIFPKSPAMHLNDINTLIDNVMGLTARQAKRQKNLTFYNGGSETEAGRVRVAPDGAIINGDPQSVKQLVIPGADPGTVNLLLQLLQFFDVSAGNLTSLMGLGAQADTVGQESLIHEAGNRKVEWMQDRVAGATSKLFRSLGLLLWHDEFKEMSMQMPVPGAEKYNATIEWKSRERAGNFFDYNFATVVSSLRQKTAQSKANELGQLVMQVFIPLAEMLQSQGGRIDLAALAEMYAELLDLPKLRNLVVFDQQPQELEQPSSSIRKPPSTTRNYVRHNTGGGQRNPSAEFFANAQSLSQQQQSVAA